MSLTFATPTLAEPFIHLCGGQLQVTRGVEGVNKHGDLRFVPTIDGPLLQIKAYGPRERTIAIRADDAKDLVLALTAALAVPVGRAEVWELQLENIGFHRAPDL